MPTLLFISMPTDEVLTKEGKVRFPGTEKAVEQLTEAGWDVHHVEPGWPAVLETANELNPDAILVACYVRAPRSRDNASMLARMQERPVYTVGVLQKDDAFRTMAPTVGVLTGIDKLPKP